MSAGSRGNKRKGDAASQPTEKKARKRGNQEPDELDDNLSININNLDVHADPLGHGSFGKVWKGSWSEAIDLVAVKEGVLAAEEISREVRTMAQLHHPHICQVYGQCVIPNEAVWIVMQLAEEGTLGDLLVSQDEPLAYNTILSFALQATMAVKYLHSRPEPILHRDIKSSNFLVHHGNLLLTDFGLAKEKATIGTSTRSTKNYSAPEVLKAKPSWTVKADIYSLGMLFYELVTGKIPFIGEDEFNIGDLVTNGQRPQIPPSCPVIFKELIEQCWDGDSSKRPTASELLDELHKITADIPLEKLRRNSHHSVPSKTFLGSMRLVSVTKADLLLAKDYNPALLIGKAAETGDTKEVERLVMQGVHIESLYLDLTPLLLAAKGGHTDTVTRLVDLHASLDATFCGNNALHYAAEHGHCSTAVKLLKYGIPIEARNKDGDTPLMRGAAFGNLEVVMELIRLGANVDATNGFGDTILHKAARSGRVNLVLEVLKYQPDINYKNKYGSTPLLTAAGSTFGYPTVQQLIKLGATIDEPDMHGRTPLIAAAQLIKPSIMNLLINNGANIHHVDKEGTTPLMAAAKHGSEACTEELLHRRVDVNQGDKKRNTALMVAAAEGHRRIVQLLLQSGAKAAQTNATGRTAVMFAEVENHTEVLEVLRNHRETTASKVWCTIT